MKIHCVFIKFMLQCNCTISIGNGVKSIREGAFNNTAYYNDLKNWTNGVLYIGNYVIYAKPSLTGEYTIKEGTLTIADFAFVDCNNLTNITIPESVTSIGDWAFSGCSSLGSLTIPDSVISIGNFTFYGCTALTSITIPDSVISIGDSEFESCSVLTSIYYNGTMEQWNAIDKGERWNFYTGNYTIVCSDGNISKN